MRRRELRRGSLLPASRTPVAEDEPGGWYEAYGVTEGGPVGRLPKDPETGITPEERMEPGAATETAPIVTAVVCELTVPSDQGGAGSSWAPPDPDASVPDQTVDALRAILRTAGGQVEDVPGAPGAVTAVFGPEDPDGEGPIRAVRVAAEVRERIEGPVEDGRVTPATRVRVGVGTAEVLGEGADAEELWRQRVIDLATRLQRMAEPGEVIVAEGVYRRIGDVAELTPVDPHASPNGGPTGPLRLIDVTPDPATATLGVPPLVGREPELERIRSAGERAASERRAIPVRLLGDPGSGKTRLLREVLDERAGDGSVVLHVACGPRRRRTPRPAPTRARRTVRSQPQPTPPRRRRSRPRAAAGWSPPSDPSRSPSGSRARAGGGRSAGASGAGGHCIVQPPSTYTSEPVMYEDPPEARNATTAAISSGQARRPMGVAASGHSPAETVDPPRPGSPYRVTMAPPREVLEIDGREVAISNPGKVFFPRTGHTKLDLVRYYLAVVDGALRGVAGRPMALKRYVNGADGEFFFQKRAPKSRPGWVETVELSFPSGRTADEIVVSDAAQLAWVVNLGCIDLNPHPVRADDLDHPDELRIDLDPVPGIGWGQIRDVAMVANEVLRDFGLTGWPKTSGSRGIHVYCRIHPRWTFPEVRRAALALAREVERRAPELATSRWWKEERHGVFLDYNQNAKDRTVASAYSVRPTPDARVSAPLTWDEVPMCEAEAFTIDTVPERMARIGDPAEGIDDAAGSLEPLLELASEHEAAGFGDAPWPPHFQKQAGEPPRVQPSKRRRERAGAVPPPAPGKSAGPTGRRRSSMPLIEVARAATREEAMDGLARWRARHPDAWARLAPADVLVDAMRGRFTTWTRIRLNLRNVPEDERPAQEPLEVDYDPWAELRDRGDT